MKRWASKRRSVHRMLSLLIVSIMLMGPLTSLIAENPSSESDGVEVTTSSIEVTESLPSETDEPSITDPPTEVTEPEPSESDEPSATDPTTEVSESKPSESDEPSATDPTTEVSESEPSESDELSAVEPTTGVVETQSSDGNESSVTEPTIGETESKPSDSAEPSITELITEVTDLLSTEDLEIAEAEDKLMARGLFPDEQGFWFSPLDAAIFMYTGNATEIEIPFMMEGIYVREVDGFSDKGLTSVILPYTLERIGNAAFKGNELKSIDIPNGVTTIGSGAFEDNLLERVSLSAYLETIGDSAFNNNYLETVFIPNSVTTIGWQAFYFNLLTSVEFGTSQSSSMLKSISVGAFAENLLTSITLPSQLETIDQGAFARNKLTSITIPDSVTTVGYSAFYLNEIESVSLGSGIYKIEEAAFESNKITDIVIPSNVTKIEMDAFADNSLTSLIIPDTVRSIGPRAFKSNQISSLTLPRYLTSIGSLSFFDNPISVVDLPYSIGSITYADGAGDDLLNPTNQQIIDECFSSTTRYVPEAVTGLSRREKGRTIYLAWDAAPGAEGYMIYRQGPGESQMTYHQLLIGTKFVDIVDQDGQYRYRIYAYVKDGEEYVFGPSPAGSIIYARATSPVITAPTNPVTGLVARANGRVISLSWDAVEGVEGYLIYRQAPGENELTYLYMKSDPFYNDKVTQDGYHYYRVVPYVMDNGKILTGPSTGYVYANATSPVITPPTPPTPPTPSPPTEPVTGLVAQANGLIISLKWNPVAGVEGYLIYCQAPDEDKLTYLYMKSDPYYNDKVTQEGYHYYRVIPYIKYDGKFLTGPSTSYVYANATSPMITRPTEPVTGLTIKANGSIISLKWNPVAEVDGYLIYRQAPGESKLTYLYMKSGTFYNDRVTQDGYHYYRVIPYVMDNGKILPGPSTGYVYAYAKAP